MTKKDDIAKCYNCINCKTENGVHFYKGEWKCSRCEAVYPEKQDKKRPSSQFSLEGQKQFPEDQMFGDDE